ncbi:MAG: putative Ig domain-containing protein [archaeon]
MRTKTSFMAVFMVCVAITGALNALALPLPSGVSGVIYELDGVTSVPAGVDYEVINADTHSSVAGKTGRYSDTGRYSASLGGSIGDTIIVRARNKANQANKSLRLEGVMKGINLILNMSLPDYPPNITSYPARGATEDALYQYGVQAAEYNGDPLEFSLIDAPAAMLMDRLGAITWMPVQADVGNHTVAIQVSDGQFNVTQVYSLEVKGVNDAPAIISGEIISAVQGQPYYYDINAVDEDGDPLIYSLAQGVLGMLLDASTGELRWVPGNDDVGVHYVSVQVTDGALFDIQQFHIQVSDINDAPAILSAPNTTAYENSLYQYQVMATDADSKHYNVSLGYGLLNGPEAMNITPGGRLLWVPGDADPGNWDVTVKVTDGNLTANQSFVLNVINVNDPPEIRSIPVYDGVAGEFYRYQVIAADPDNDQLSYLLISSPDGMGIDGQGLVSWAATGGVHKVTLGVTDGTVLARQSFMIQVYEQGPTKAGGGGGAGGGAGSKKDSYSKRIDLASNIVEFSSSGLPGDAGLVAVTMMLNAMRNPRGPDMMIREFRSKPGAVDVAPAYTLLYLSMEPAGLEHESLERTTVRFRIRRSLLEQNGMSFSDALLLRYTGTWEQLPTVISGYAEDYVYYESETPGFSYFAIALSSPPQETFNRQYTVDSPPEPFTIVGQVWNNGSEAANGTRYILSNLNTHKESSGLTGGPSPGAFLHVVEGSAGDMIQLSVPEYNETLVIRLESGVSLYEAVIGDKPAREGDPAYDYSMNASADSGIAITGRAIAEIVTKTPEYRHWYLLAAVIFAVMGLISHILNVTIYRKT